MSVVRWLALGAALALVGGCGGDGDAGRGLASEESVAATASAAWGHAGHDLENSRAAGDDEGVAPDAVAGLRARWDLTDVLGVSGTPVVADGTLYVGDWAGHVRALAADDGALEWDAALGDAPVPGAVALADELVFAASSDGELHALDRATGDEAWTTPVDEHPAAMVWGSPVHVDGLVVLGVASDQELTGDTPTFRGSVVAFDAASGDEVWRYRTSDADAGDGPGVGVWSSPAVDVDAGRIYIGTGNNTAPPTSSRSDALVALDLSTGEEVWATQLTAGDVASTGDVGATPNLLTVDGRPAVGVGDKAGVYHALDRETGEELWSAQLTEGGVAGGVNGSAAVADGVVYVASNHGGTVADLFALDGDDGEVVWQTSVGGPVFGSVTWADGVVYVAEIGGYVRAFDDAAGAELWSEELPATAAGGIAVAGGMVYVGSGWWIGEAPPDIAGSLVAFGR